MVAERTLLERIAASGQRRAANYLGQDSALPSVVANLRQIFNARQGCASIRPDYGMPELGDLMFGFPQIVPEIARSIKLQIETFEPRLTNVQVRERDDVSLPGTVRFSIRAELAGEIAGPIVLDGALSGDGHLEVSA